MQNDMTVSRGQQNGTKTDCNDPYGFSGKVRNPETKRTGRTAKGADHIGTGLPESGSIRGLAEYSHIWVIWEFSQAKREKWSPTVKPPRLGGNKRMGVFATRSPFRPNPIGLSALKLDSIEYHKTYGPVLHVSGVDMLDGTPVYDIKPYLPYADSYPDATDGFAGRVRGNRIAVSIPEEMLIKIEEKERDTIKQLLSQDPRTAYVQDAERIWGLSYQQYNIRFRVENETAYVLDVEIKQGADRLYRKREADREK